MSLMNNNLLGIKIGIYLKDLRVVLENLSK
jgi:hypothetical protein